MALKRKMKPVPDNKRFTIMCNQLEHCIVCGRIHPEKHEVFFGNPYRERSKQYGLVLPLCYEHHRGDHGPHKCHVVDEKYKKAAQTAWEQIYGSREDFISIFGRSYL